MRIEYLDKAKYEYFELEYDYITSEHYKVTVSDDSDEMGVRFEREKYDSPRREHNIDTLYQDYWQDAEAYAAYDDDGSVLGYVEFAFSEWNNTLQMTQLLVLPGSRGRGVGKALFEFVKGVALERDYRVILLEAQNYNTPAIDFYRAMGFKFCGANLYFYSNTDVEDDEVMLQMAYLVE